METDVNSVDVTDAHITRKTRHVSANKANIVDNFVAVVSITTFLIDIVTDALVAKQYFETKKWILFGLNLTFIIVPSVLMQLFSTKWHHDDREKQGWLSIMLHLLQLAPIERYFLAFWYGGKTLLKKNLNENDYRLYLTNWRDATMLRLVETFLESAPQVVLQLYVLSQLNRAIDLNKDWITVLAAVVSLISLAWSIVSYTHALRLCARENGLSLCGYIFQVIYRLSMIASRIVAMVLFASEYTWALFVVIFVHWLCMFIWLHFQNTNFCYSSNNLRRIFYEYTFISVLAFVYVFCFINAKKGMTRQRVKLYYILFFVENSLMIAAWYPSRKTTFGILEYGSLSIVWGAFILGLVSMLLYYKFFHPNVDVTAGWLCCSIFQKKSSSFPVSDKENGLNVGYSKTIYAIPDLQQVERKFSIGVELSPRMDIPSFVFPTSSEEEEVYRFSKVSNKVYKVEDSQKQSLQFEKSSNQSIEFYI
ncbi:XK-related protein 6 [Hydra vulgaris]|uniref:XK-related protein 6 n=1 Tax=Hydra vulgaris TaxID=6087 RepID=UPI0001925F3A|nr:XK-related protein 6 [Hydra vulgaris]XP_012564088.1 XK-related protein 6 [Hydra vulgaris]XP_047125594.1 XK-related protein 6 [Hydra vulgaris]XP_047125595.1 XK-related protein 6 [Hydra vulgaris]XP_047125596.1 XK-related protein 6 [Hydra vulgaris]